MRIDVKKFVFIGHELDKRSFFEEAQKIGIIQFKESKGIINPDIQLYSDAIRILRRFSNTLVKDGDVQLIASRILNLKQELDQLEEEIRLKKLDIQRIAIFGDFSLDDVAYLKTNGNLTIQFFCAKKGMVNHPNLIYIASQYGLDYYISLSEQQSSYPSMIEIKIERSLSQEKIHLKEFIKRHAIIEASLKEKAAYNIQLHKALTDAFNQTHLSNAQNSTEKPLDSLFTATGWVPKDKISQLKTLSIIAEEIAVDPTDNVPTHLENENFGRIGEDVINIYDTPSTQDKDPSLWVLFSFIIFFAIIIGDGGYGSVYLGLALYIRYAYPGLVGMKKRVLDLATYLAVACVGWGLLTSSFFGMQVGPTAFSLTYYLAMKKATYQGGGDLTVLTDQVLLELSLFVGVVHLIIGLVRYLKKNPGNIGWILFLIGAYLYFPVFLGAPSLLNYVFGIPFEAGGAVGLQMIYTGIFSAVGISVYRNGLIGLTEVMNLIQVFADALSYLRLYALGLSGSILAATINSMASHMPLAIAIILIIFGHLINMGLGIMGGVIHGLRLNFLEWYHYSFEGGGRKFKPLNIKE